MSPESLPFRVRLLLEERDDLGHPAIPRAARVYPLGRQVAQRPDDDVRRARVDGKLVENSPVGREQAGVQVLRLEEEQRHGQQGADGHDGIGLESDDVVEWVLALGRGLRG